MKRLILLMLVLSFLSCISSGEKEECSEANQAETYILQRFAVMYWKPSWGYGNGKTKYYLTVEVDKTTFNRFRAGDLAPLESLHSPELTPFIPDGDEVLFIFDQQAGE